MQEPNTEFNHLQDSILLWRRIELGFGCFILLAIILDLCRRRLYNYNTTKMFLFCIICYFTGMLVVLMHFGAVSSGYQFAYMNKEEKENDHYILHILKKMREEGATILCGLEAFINLFLYNIGYSFTILIAYNVYCVIHDTYRDFFRKVLKNKKIIMAFFLFLIVYLLPFIFMYFPDSTSENFSQSYFYSYGPTGFSMEIEDEGVSKSAYLLLYCGICTNPESSNSTLYKILGIVNTYICPLVLLFIHLSLLLHNRRKIRQYEQEEYLNSKQMFLVKSGSLSLVVFVIQLIHFIKLILLLSWENQYFNIVINFFFDLYPIPLAFSYWTLTKEKRGMKYGASTILSEISE